MKKIVFFDVDGTLLPEGDYSGVAELTQYAKIEPVVRKRSITECL